MKPSHLKTKLFLDSGDPQETKQVLDALGFLDGQTTNPTLIAKSPSAKERLEKGNKLSREEVNDFYKETITQIRGILSEGSISIEVAADATTPAEMMVEQGLAMNSWIAGAHIKLPTTSEGLKAARHLVDQGIAVNMTLVFSQQQAAAVYAATTGAKKGQVFLSPFIGRLDDIGQNGMDLIANILRMYREHGDGHVELLTASVRNLDHFLCAIALQSDIITAPGKHLLVWKEEGMPVPSECGSRRGDLAAIPYEEIDLSSPVDSFDIHHALTDKGLAQFVVDWEGLIA